MKKKKLSPEETAAAVERIRSLYNDYIIRYSKPFSVKNGFEERYRDALRSRIDLDGFLFAEFSVIRQLIQREEDRAAANADPPPQREDVTKKVSFADRIMEENRKRIEHYPELPLGHDASPEIKKLFGALAEFDKRYWGAVSELLRRPAFSVLYETRNHLEAEAEELCVPRRDPFPPVLSTYCRYLERFPRDWDALEREGQRCILRASFFLHRIAGFLRNAANKEFLEKEEKKRVETIFDSVHSIISDFRLHDLKPRYMEEREHGI